MEILQLKYFCDAAETQNFSKTAKKFGVPPSNISQCIKRLEKELGTSLFNRRSNSIFLNHRGEAFFDRVSKALQLLDEAKTEAENQEIRSEIKICIVANRRVVMQAIEKFRKKNPDVKFVISHIYDKSEEYDLIVTDDLFDGKDMEKKQIISEKIALAMKKDNPLAQKRKVSFEDIQGENFIGLNRESSLYATTEQFCKNHGINLNVVIQSDDPFYMRKCVELGLGVAFVPVFSWKGMFSDDVVLKPIAGFRRNTCAFRKRGKYQTRSAEDFLDTLVQECREEEKN